MSISEEVRKLFDVVVDTDCEGKLRPVFTIPSPDGECLLEACSLDELIEAYKSYSPY